MTRVEIHVFDPGVSQCHTSYVRDLVRSRSRYCRVCLSVDSAEQARHWRSELQECGTIDVFEQDADVPSVPFNGEMLISLSANISPCFSAFKQTIDLVIDNENARQHGRERYRFYRDRGYPLRHIKIQDKEATA